MAEGLTAAKVLKAIEALLLYEARARALNAALLWLVTGGHYETDMLTIGWHGAERFIYQKGYEPWLTLPQR